MALRYHLQIRMFGELFNDETAERVRAVEEGARSRPSEYVYYAVMRGLSYTGKQSAATFLLRNVFWDPSSNCPAAIGFKIFYSQARTTALARTVWEYLKRDQDVRIIHLVRRNLLESLLSLQTALVTNVWGLAGNETNPAQAPVFEVQPEEAQAYFRSVLEQRRITMAELDSPKRNILTVEYDRDLAADFEALMRRVQDFLDVPYAKLPPMLRKQGTEPVCERIRNYDSLRRHFADTPFSSFFVEDAAGRQGLANAES
jgi:hypothetical protein